MKNLLIIACGGKKVPGTGSYRAIDLYTGRQFTLARKLMRQGWNVLILSAKHGLIPVDKLIQPYDQKMTPETADTLAQDDLQAWVLDIWARPAATVVFYGGALYAWVFGALVDRLALARIGDRRNVVNIIGAGCGDHYSVLKEIVSETAEIPLTSHG